MLESQVERHLVQAVRKRGGMCVKLAPIDAGTPDRMVILPGGRLYLVELKTETGRVRPIQKVWHARAAKLGVKVVILHGVRGVDVWLEEVEEA